MTPLASWSLVLGALLVLLYLQNINWYRAKLWLIIIWISIIAIPVWTLLRVLMFVVRIRLAWRLWRMT